MSTRPTASEVSAELSRRIEALCRDLLGSGRRKSSYWTVGGTDNSPGGSMWVHLSGEKQGNWQDAATGEFGDALDLLAACRYAGDKKTAYAAGLLWLGWATGATEPARKAPPSRPKIEVDAETARKRAYALRLYLEARPSILDTPVDHYLQARGINIAALGRQPRALRFHPDLRHRESGHTFPAMIAAISGPDGSHVATHRTYLERTGGGWIKARLNDAKLSIGDFAGGSIRLWRGASGKSLKDMPWDEDVFLGEGIETCLSVAQSLPDMRVLCGVSLGNLGSVWLPDQARRVIIGGDNDIKPAARAALQRAAERHMDRGREVRIARSPEGNDFNDIIRVTA
jgi:hypothetical protein